MSLMGVREGQRMRERQPCLPLLSITSLDHSLSQIQRVKVDASCLSLQMRLALLILCLFKCVKDANGFNDTVFKDLDVEGMVEDAHDPFLISKKTSPKESCSQVSFPKSRTENKAKIID